jgi:hypothetical protein
MNFDLDQHVHSLPAWEFTVQVGGVVYPTRRPTAEDFIEIAEISKRPTDAARRVRELVDGMFVGAGPDLSGAPFDSLVAMLRSLIKYHRGYATTLLMIEASAGVLYAKLLQEQAAAKE